MNRMGFAARISTLVFAGFVVMALPSSVSAEDAADPSRFTYARLYCTPDGESHFQNVTVELRQMNFAPPASPINRQLCGRERVLRRIRSALGH